MPTAPKGSATGPRSHYEVLGVDTTASREAIRQAYREQARRHHPDARNVEPLPADGGGGGRGGGAMAAVNEAWKVLGDPVRRQAYDIQLGNSASASTGWRPLRDDDSTDGRSAGGITVEDLDDWSDRPPRPTRPGDLLVMVPVLLALAAVGLFFFSAMAGSTKLRAVSLCFIPIALVGFVAAPLLTMLRSRGEPRR